MIRDAAISACGRYRYWLLREWAQKRRRAALIMLNPSTADAASDDATIRSCLRLCRHHGFGRLEVVNLFALRATDPRELGRADDPVGPDNDDWLRLTCRRRGVTVICAWGANPIADARAHRVLKMIGGRPRCLGRTASGAPRHPLYLPTGTELEEYP